MGVGGSPIRKVSVFMRKTARCLGFRFLLAWCFLVLFTPLLTGMGKEDVSHLIFKRQLILILSMILMFLLLGFFGKLFLRTAKRVYSLVMYGVVGALCMLFAALVLVVSLSDSLPTVYGLVTMALLGCCVTVLLYLWIQHLLTNRGIKSCKGLAVDMTLGAIIALTILCLQQPLSSVVFSVLPGVAAFSLLALWSPCSKRPKESSLCPTMDLPLLAKQISLIPASREVPWQDACGELARLYQLSPRETEVFLLLAKGRNAEFIQGKLVISLHTAKSHIANIYQKLDVHSIQEMLDLIDLFIEDSLDPVSHPEC